MDLTHPLNVVAIRHQKRHLVLVNRSNGVSGRGGSSERLPVQVGERRAMAVGVGGNVGDRGDVVRVIGCVDVNSVLAEPGDVPGEPRMCPRNKRSSSPRRA